MNHRRMTVFIVAFACMFFLTASQVLAARGCQGTNEGVLEQFKYPQAPGTKVFARLAIYYGPPNEVPPGSMLDPTSMYVMASAGRAGEQCSFSTITSPVGYGDYLQQVYELGVFFQDTVLPSVLGCVGDACPALCHPEFFPEGCLQPSYFSLKSTADVIEDNNQWCGPDSSLFQFMMLDVVLGVVE